MNINTLPLQETDDASYDTRQLINNLMEAPASLESFYVCDLDDIVEKHIRWTELMPRVKPYYAVKCNNHPAVLRLLAALNTGFDCASNQEIDSVLKLGVDPDRIIFANPVKIISHIQHAVSKNVSYNTFDSELELQKCKKYYPNAKLIIRIKRDASKAVVKFGAKFGCDPYEEAPKLLKIAKELELNVVGVAFHVGCWCSDVFAYRHAIQDAKFLFDYAQSLGFNFDLLDIGGGFPGNKDNPLDVFADVINSAIKEYFPDPSTKIVAEPGTYYVRSAFTLYSSIHGIKEQIKINDETGDEQNEYMYYIAEGVFHSFCRVLAGFEKVQPKLLKNSKLEALHKTTIWGQTLDATDKIADELYLPKAEMGDWMMFENMGDYSISVCSNFNGFLNPDVFVVASKKTLSFFDKEVPQLANSECKAKTKRTGIDHIHTHDVYTE